MKNYKLLLATTAILSVGAFMANAEFKNPEVDVKAKASFVTSITTSVEPISFGVIDPRAGGSVSIDAYTGVASGDALIVYGDPTRGKVAFTGIKGFFDANALPSYNWAHYIHLVLDSEKIDLYENEANKTGKCGTVDPITESVGEYSSSGTGSIDIYLGGTLNIESGYIPSNGYKECTGTQTITYVLTVNNGGSNN